MYMDLHALPHYSLWKAHMGHACSWMCAGAMQVTLLVPWLAKCEQEIVYPDNIRFETSEEQAKWVKSWVEKRVDFPCSFQIRFYPGRYDASFLSIFPVGDPTVFIPDHEVHSVMVPPP